MSHTDEQIVWYDRNAQRTMQLHFAARTWQIIFAAAIVATQAALSGDAARIVAAALGSAITILQGIDGLHHYGDHYTTWRVTAQKLKQERYLFASQAGAYSSLEVARALPLLAQRTTAIESQENEAWERLQQSTSGDTAGQPTAGNA